LSVSYKYKLNLIPLEEKQMVAITITALALGSIISIIAGILVLIWPKILNYLVAAWLMITGLLGLLSAYSII